MKSNKKTNKKGGARRPRHPLGLPPVPTTKPMSNNNKKKAEQARIAEAQRVRQARINAKKKANSRRLQNTKKEQNFKRATRKIRNEATSTRRVSEKEKYVIDLLRKNPSLSVNQYWERVRPAPGFWGAFAQGKKLGNNRLNPKTKKPLVKGYHAKLNKLPNTKEEATKLFNSAKKTIQRNKTTLNARLKALRQ